MKRFFIIFSIFLVFLSFSSCSRNKNKIKDLFGTNNRQEEKINGFYRFYAGQRDGFNIWIVDGALIRRTIFNEFIYGGNDERYPFVPDKEIWIDNTISSEEYEMTVAHEINERRLMEKFKMAYFDAHDSSLALELQMRRNFKKICEEHENGLKEVAPIDFDSTQEITDIPETIKLKNIYRIPLGERNGIKIWIVDGYAVRRDIYPDFGFSGNDKAYHFIPDKEIWIDGEVSCEETEYSIALEMKERELIDKGIEYDSAYTNAVQVSDKLREEQMLLCNSQKMISKPEQVARDTGIEKP
ncbi:MAG: hypothetical protein ACHQJ4_04045 [Ignavibacteria bacterium]